MFKTQKITIIDGIEILSYEPDYWLLAAIILGALASISLYLLPTIIAAFRKHNDFLLICILNVLLGWSIIAWIIALCLSLSKKK